MNIKQTLVATAVLSSAALTGPVMAGQAENVQTVRDFYQLLEEKDVARWAQLLAEDAVQDMPYAPSNFIPRVETREAIHKHFSGFPDGTNDVRFEILSIYPSTDEKIVLAEIDGMIEFKGVEKPYEQQYMMVFKFNDAGEIMLFREYFNPIPFAEAVGLGKYVVAQ